MKEDSKYPQDSLKNARDYIIRSSMPEEQKKIVTNYFNGMQVGDACSKHAKPETVRGAVFVCCKFGDFIKKPFEEVTKQDIVDFLSSLKERGLMSSTVSFYGVRLRHFFKWQNNGETPAFVDWIKKNNNKKRLDASQLLSPSEIKRLVEIADNSRDKAIILGLYESGCRISEWLNIRMKDIVFDDFGSRIAVTGKTGKRTIRLIDTVPYLNEWLKDHPFKTNKEHYLFINFASNHYGNRMCIGAVGTLLRTYCKRAEIQKNIYPHLLRHSRLTWLAQQEGFNERDLRIFAGWSSSSDMPDTYLHYGEEEVDKKLRKTRGLLDEKETEKDRTERKSLIPKECPRCRQQNVASALYCNCGQVLDIKESTKIEVLKNKAIEQAMEEFMRLVQQPERLKEFQKFSETFGKNNE